MTVAGSDRSPARDRAAATWSDGGGRAVAGVALAALALPMAIIAGMLLVAQGRPILFRQARVGKGGRTFLVPKFRTMTDARDASGWLLPDDRRLTAAGRILRRLRLDELPQLQAIARGDMAFVGPRPLLPATIEGFGPLAMARCLVRPGLTGWAQVSGNTRLTEREKLALDLWYIDHRSAALDLRILLLTGLTVLRGERVDGARVRIAEAYVKQAHPA